MDRRIDISFHVYDSSWKTRLRPYCKAIQHILENALDETRLKNCRGLEIAVVLADDSFVRDLNKKYRGKDKPTNVLSFPDPDFSLKPGAMSRNLGDIVLAMETIYGEAKGQKKTFRDHAAHLLTHGFLHLLGYDHIEEKQAGIMEKKEIKILKKLGISNPYL